MDTLPEMVRSALVPILGVAERVERYAPAVGCTLVLTDRRLVLVREGASFRPRSGVQSWVLGPELTVQLAAGRDTTRLIIDQAGHSVSVFLKAGQEDDARTLLGRLQERTDPGA